MKKIWYQTLKIWETIANIPNKQYFGTCTQFKKEIIKQLKFDLMYFGCPLCEKFLKDNDDCEECPIGEYYHTSYACEKQSPYSKWSYEMAKNYQHIQKYAQEFYEFLLMLAKEDGYEPLRCSNCRYRDRGIINDLYFEYQPCNLCIEKTDFEYWESQCTK